jgi:hypothetical protein
MNENFKELQNVDEANQVDLKIWSFVKLSDQRGYVFKRRSK